MVFCGQCGLQLAPGTICCPRCGTFTDTTTSGATIEAANGDDPTAMIRRAPNTSQATYGAVDQPPLILRDTSGTAHDTYPPRVTSPGGNVGYPAQGASHGDFHTPGLPGYPASSGAYQPLQPTPIPARKTGRRVASLLLILFGVLLLLGAMALFAFRHNVFPGTTGNGNTPTPAGNTGGVGSVTATAAVTATVTPASAAQQAQAVIEQYYTDVNNQDYQSAYALWYHYPDSLANFEQGYAHTQHVTLQIANVVALNDGTEQVFATLNAQEDNASGQGSHYSLYKGYYIVGPVNGTWLILKGQFR